jgi:hypothetical protein
MENEIPFCILHSPMGLLDSEAGKHRLLSVEIPVIERYNEWREHY